LKDRKCIDRQEIHPEGPLCPCSRADKRKEGAPGRWLSGGMRKIFLDITLAIRRESEPAPFSYTVFSANIFVAGLCAKLTYHLGHSTLAEFLLRH
jgi:hypothetical protein